MISNSFGVHAAINLQLSCRYKLILLYDLAIKILKMFPLQLLVVNTIAYIIRYIISLMYNREINIKQIKRKKN